MDEMPEPKPSKKRPFNGTGFFGKERPKPKHCPTCECHGRIEVAEGGGIGPHRARNAADRL